MRAVLLGWLQTILALAPDALVLAEGRPAALLAPELLPLVRAQLPLLALSLHALIGNGWVLRPAVISVHLWSGNGRPYQRRCCSRGCCGIAARRSWALPIGSTSEQTWKRQRLSCPPQTWRSSTPSRATASNVSTLAGIPRRCDEAPSSVVTYISFILVSSKRRNPMRRFPPSKLRRRCILEVGKAWQRLRRIVAVARRLNWLQRDGLSAPRLPCLGPGSGLGIG